MAFSEVEGFNVANGTLLTSTNCPGITGTTFVGTGTVVSDTSWSKDGASSAKFTTSDGTSSSTIYRDITQGTTRAWRFYGKIPASVPTSNVAICIVKNTHSGTMITQMYLNGSGDAVPSSIKVQGSDALIIGSKTAALTAGTVFRADVNVNSSAGSVVWNLYLGANVDGTTPDYTWTKASGNGATTPGSVLLGLLTTTGSAASIQLDTLAEATDGTTPGTFSATATVIRPLTDITTSGWTKVNGATYSAAVNESITDDTSYDESPVAPSSSVIEWKLAAGSFPGSTGGHIVTVRMEAVSAVSSSVTCALVQGTTIISSSTFTNISSSYTDYSWTLTPTEASNITDYTDLRIRVTATAS